jgi:LuxR family maltose regulon positive regulatory protein
MSEQTTAAPTARRHIIKRPRLTRLLDEATARIILLVAPAGYGKTTLARQWCDTVQDFAWYRCTTASTDVAAFVAGVAGALGSLAPRAGLRAREVLRLASISDQQLDKLADIVAEEVPPHEILLALDDFHLVSDSVPAQHFFECLLERTTIRILVTTRQRPRWADARKILYGEILEIGPNLLAITYEEACAVLGRRSPEEVRRLHAAAKGWPAVIGLAALTEEPLGEAELDGSLYGYFAEELLRGMPSKLQPALLRLALLPSLTPAVAEGFAKAETIRRAVELGFLTQDGSRFEIFHPLLRNFVIRRTMQSAPEQLAAAVDAVGSYLISRGMWDDALTLLEEFPSGGTLVVKLLEEGFEDLLLAGRVSTLARLVAIGREQKLASAAIELAEAELSLRDGKHQRAHSLAVAAAASDAPQSITLRSLLLAGRSANLSDRYDLSYEYYRRAFAAAQTPSDKSAALWGQLIAAYFIELPNIQDILSQMSSVDDTSDETRLRFAIAQFYVACLAQRNIHDCLDLFRATEHLVARVSDPVMAVGYLQAHAYASILAGEYASALTLADKVDDLASNHSLTFVRPMAHATRGYAQFGLGLYTSAATTVGAIEDEASELGDAHTILNARQLRARLLLASAEFVEALRISTLPRTGRLSKAMVGEILATRGLAYACLHQWSRAGSALVDARKVTRSLEASGAVTWTEAVIAVLQEAKDQDRTVAAAVQQLEATGYVDGFLVVLRACPKLRGPLAPFVDRVGPIGELTSLPIRPQRRGREDLSSREREVADLIGAGFTNREIAQALVISEATVKVHVRHILEKLHARSRAEVASRLVVRQAMQPPGF